MCVIVGTFFYQIQCFILLSSSVNNSRRLIARKVSIFTMTVGVIFMVVAVAIVLVVSPLCMCFSALRIPKEIIDYASRKRLENATMCEDEKTNKKAQCFFCLWTDTEKKKNKRDNIALTHIFSSCLACKVVKRRTHACRETYVKRVFSPLLEMEANFLGYGSILSSNIFSRKISNNAVRKSDKLIKKNGSLNYHLRKKYTSVVSTAIQVCSFFSPFFGFPFQQQRRDSNVGDNNRNGYNKAKVN